MIDFNNKIRINPVGLNDNWLRFGVVPVLSVIGQWLFFDSRQLVMKDYVLARYTINLVYAIALWEVCRKIIIYSRVKFPNFEDNSKRLPFQLIGFLISIFILRIILNSFLYFTIFTNGFDLFNFFYGAFVTTLFLIPFAAIYEIIYFYRGWKIVNIEAQQLRKMNIESQLNSLRNQINPHFLFNNLNTLSSLILSDTSKAERFLEQLSTVYRYLLQKNQGNLSSLADELSFAESYASILKIRFHDAFFYEKNIDPKWLSFQIPTHTLQVIFENAIRHNVVSVQKPLSLTFFVENGKLVCQNNLQKKNLAINTNKEGLSNLTLKYEILSKEKVEISETPQFFEVKLPLIKP